MAMQLQLVQLLRPTLSYYSHQKLRISQPLLTGLPLPNRFTPHSPQPFHYFKHNENNHFIPQLIS